MQTVKNQRTGLTSAEAEKLRGAFGENVLPKAKKRSFLRIFLGNLGDPVIRILLGALAVNLIFLFRGGDVGESAGIALSVLLATMISSISEYRRDSAFEALRESSEGEYRVLRDGEYSVVRAEEITVGDVISLSAGEKVPADSILLSGSASLNQSALTGESEEVEKAPNEAQIRVLEASVRDFTTRGNREKIDTFRACVKPSDPFALFSGCFLVGGSGEAMVFSVGKDTEVGKLAGNLGAEEKSPLREKLTFLAKEISIIGYVASVLIALAYLFNVFVIDSSFLPKLILAKLRDLPFLFSSLFRALTLALTVIVVAVPEGLPMMIAVVLAKNASRMSRDNVLVRRSEGIEAAGCMNILFTDKTGTLTRGEPRVVSLLTPFGEFRSLAELERVSPALAELLELNAFANSDAVRSRGKVIGKNPAEKALLEALGRKRSADFERISYEPFDSKKKFSSATVRSGGRTLKLLKGAPEILLSRADSFLAPDGSPLPLARSAFECKIREKTLLGERVLLLSGEERGRVILHAAVSMSDPLRRDAKASVSALKGAGIQTVMVTGDCRETAEKAASDCGILCHSRPLSLSGSELDALSDDELREALPRLSVVSRALPSHKLRLVRAAKALDLTVGMTGDGLNDAPALSSADCGFALGCGTEVSKEASDVIILDNRLASVVNAVMHGRNITKSIRKFITLQLVMNFTAMAVSMLGPFIGIEAPVTVVQMLWINIVMDTLGGLAFAGEAAEKRILREKPKTRRDPVIDRETKRKVARLSVFSAALCIFFLKSPWVHSLFGTEEGSLYHLTAFFALFIFAGAANCFNARSDRVNLFAGLGRNPTFIAVISLVAAVQVALIYLGADIVRTVPLEPRHLALTVLFALPVILFELIVRIFGKLR